MKIGFVGAGFIARFQAVAIEQVRGVEIAGMTRRRGSEALSAWCRQRGLGDARIHDSIAGLVKLGSRKIGVKLGSGLHTCISRRCLLVSFPQARRDRHPR